MNQSLLKLLSSVLCFCLLTFFTNTAYAEPSLIARPITEGRLAFTYIVGEKSDIYVIDFAANTIANLVTSPSVDAYPTWSPDGTKLVFHSDRTKNREIFVIDWDGNNLTQLTKTKDTNEDPEWSPDGKQLVFHSTRLGRGSNLFIMDADGKNPRNLTNNRSRNSVPRWSPRGDEILYTTNARWPGWDIMLYNLTTKEEKALTSGVISYCRASWNRNGSDFAYSYGSGPDIDIYLQDKGSSTSTKLTSRRGREYDATWALNDEWLFFVSELNRGEQDYQIFALNMKNKKEVVQITSGAGNIRYLSYTPFPTVGQMDIN